MKKTLNVIFFIMVCFNVESVKAANELIKATHYNDINKMQIILENGFDPNLADSNGNTAYCFAYSKKNYQSAKLLQQYGANTNVKCKTRTGYFMTEALQTAPVAAPVLAASNHPRAYTVGPTQTVSSTKSNKATGAVIGTLALGGAVALIATSGGSDSNDDSSSGGGGDNGKDPGENLNLDKYRTPEFYGDVYATSLSGQSNSKFLSIMNAEYAYARGYNGAGEKIAILDTGIDMHQQEFVGQINPNLTNTDYYNRDSNPGHSPDSTPHGSWVASVAAANKNNSAMQGVAYGSKIIPYRLGDYGIAYWYTDDAIKDGISKGAEVFNMSFGTPSSSQYNAANVSKDQIEASYIGYSDSNDNTNTIPMNELITQVRANNAILVRAAGNDSQSQSALQSALPLHYSEFNGHFINVVALNEAGDGLASYSNHCGVTRNYCLAAPGTNILAASNNGNYVINSGTSMAAPAVSGAVAVVKSAFPYLTAPEVTNILFSTAKDLGVIGVDTVYGHGLVDLAAATSPTLGLNALNSDLQAVDFAGSKIKSSGAINNVKVANFVVTDNLNRTFSINSDSINYAEENQIELQDRMQTYGDEPNILRADPNSKLRTSFISTQGSITGMESFDHINVATSYQDFDVTFGFTSNPGAQFEDSVRFTNLIEDDVLAHPYLGIADNGFTATNKYMLSDKLSMHSTVFFGDVEFDDEKVGTSSAFLTKLDYQHTDATSYALQFGLLNENSTLLGSSFEGAFGLADNTYTYFTGVEAKTKLTEKLDIFANAYLGFTDAQQSEGSLINNIDSLYSHAASLGLNYNHNDNQQFGFIFAQPLKVASGSFSYDVATSRLSDGSYAISNVNQDLATEATEFNLQGFYKHKLSDETKLNLGLIHKINADNIKGNEDTAALIKLKHNF